MRALQIMGADGPTTGWPVEKLQRRIAEHMGKHERGDRTLSRDGEVIVWQQRTLLAVSALHQPIDRPALPAMMHAGETLAEAQEARTDCSCGRVWRACPTATALGLNGSGS